MEISGIDGDLSERNDTHREEVGRGVRIDGGSGRSEVEIARTSRLESNVLYKRISRGWEKAGRSVSATLRVRGGCGDVTGDNIAIISRLAVIFREDDLRRGAEGARSRRRPSAISGKRRRRTDFRFSLLLLLFAKASATQPR